SIPAQGVRTGRKLADGKLVTLENGLQLTTRDPKGTILKMSQCNAGGAGCNEILETGNVLINSPGNGNLIEFDADAKVVKQFDMPGCVHGYRLPNDHTLVTIGNGNNYKYIELDAKFQPVATTELSTPVFRVKRR